MASLDKSTAQRLLHRLLLERLLKRDPVRGYCLGPLLYELGLATLPETNLGLISQGALHELARTTGDMVFLVVRSGFESVCLNRIAGNFPIQTMTRTEGDRHPLGIGAGGLAILASMRDTDIDAVVKAIEPRLATYGMSCATLLEAVARTRERRDIAIDEGSAALDVTAIGRTVHDGTRAPVAAVFVASISRRMVESRQKQVIKHLIACTNAIEPLLLKRE